MVCFLNCLLVVICIVEFLVSSVICRLQGLSYLNVPDCIWVFFLLRYRQPRARQLILFLAIHTPSWYGKAFRYRSFVRKTRISITKEQWCEGSVFVLLARTICWTNCRVADGLRRHNTHVTSQMRYLKPKPRSNSTSCESCVSCVAVLPSVP